MFANFQAKTWGKRLKMPSFFQTQFVFENIFLTLVETGFLGSSPSSLLGSQLASTYTKKAAMAA